MDEKQLGLPVPNSQTPKSPRSRKWASIFLGTLACLLYLQTFVPVSRHSCTGLKSGKGKGHATCEQVPPLKPHDTPELIRMDEFLRSDTFRNESLQRLRGAIQIRTESFDDMGSVEDDERWTKFFAFATYLETQFPLVNTTLKRERVNTHGLLYTWEGSDSSLKPTVLMAHQDTVPVARATVNQWTHDPFGGYFDGKYIWGRGASDCKNNVIGILGAAEQLIQAGFKPKRTVVMSFGFDEEISGTRGARNLAAHLVARYKSVGGAAVVVDEGGSGYNLWGSNFAVPGVAEKGYTDTEIIVRMPGGHSSIPPAHTGIGVAAELISAIEAQPSEPHFYPENPFLGLLQCGAAHGPEFPHKLKKMLRKYKTVPRGKHDKLAAEAAKLGPQMKYLFTTSQAVDVIDGGVKTNALPERTRFLVNFRINVGESSEQVNAKVTKIASTIANKYNLTLHAFSNETETPSSITLNASPNTIEPAPVTPTSVDGVTPYSVLSGSLRALYGEDMIVSPALMSGNSDTRYYWDLSDHIFRYNPGFDPSAEDPFKSIHTVNEKITAVTHVTTVQWYSLFVRNMDEAILA